MYIFLIVCKVTNNQLYTQAKHIFMNVQILYLYIFMNVQTLLTALLLPSLRFPPPLSVFLPHLRSLSVDCAP